MKTEESDKKYFYQEGSLKRDQSPQKFAVDECRPVEGSPKRPIRRPVAIPRSNQKLIAISAAVALLSAAMPRQCYVGCGRLRHAAPRLRSR